MKRYSRSVSVVACLAVCAAVTSCGSDDAAGTTEATTGAATDATTEVTTAGGSTVPVTAGAPSADACADRQALRDSIAALADIDVVAEGTNGLTAAVDAVKADLEKVQASAGSTVKPQVQAVKDAIAAAEAGLQNLGDGGAAEVEAALTDLSTATTTLLTSLEDGPCG